MKKWSSLALVIPLLVLASIAGGAVLFNSFNSGQLDKQMQYRLDVDKRSMGVEEISNMLVNPKGMAYKRPGTKYIAATKENSRVRLIPFEYSTDDAYVIEMGNEYARFYREQGRILGSGEGTEDLSALDNVIAHYLMNDTTGTTVYDALGSHNGTASADVSNFAAAGHVGLGCFDLAGQYDVTISDHDDFSFTDDSDDDPFSIMCWAYVTDYEGFQNIISKWRGNSSTREWRFGINENKKLQLNLSDTSTDLSTNRIAQYYLDDDAANTHVDDVTTNHDGVATANTEDLSTTGMLGDCLDLDGDEAVEINDDDELSFGDGSNDSAFSISAWVYIKSDAASDGYILSKMDYNSRLREWALRILRIGQPTYSEFMLYDESAHAYENIRTDDPIATGWRHIVGTYSGVGGESASGGLKIYIDGALVNSTEYDAGTYVAMENLSTKMVIGACYWTDGNLGRYLNTKIDNVILFDTELTAAQAAAVYHLEAGQDLVGIDVWSVSDDAVNTGWHLLGCTYSAPADETTAADGIIFYVDGEAVSSTATNSDSYTAMQNGAEEVRIGAQRKAPDTADIKFYADKLDEMSVFSDVLTPAEIASLYTEDIYEITTPYLTADLPGIQYVQDNDVMYLVHPDYPPQKLSRYDHNNWTIEDANFSKGPFLVENTDTSSTITPSGSTGNITLTATGGPFHAGHVGALWQMTNPVDTNIVTKNFYAYSYYTPASTQYSNNLSVAYNQDYIITTGDIWKGTAIIQRSTDKSTWTDIYSITSTPSNSSSGRNINYSGTETIEDAYYRVKMYQMYAYYLGNDKDATHCGAQLTAIGYLRQGVAQITTYNDANNVDATVLYTLGGTNASSQWSEGAWSDYRGWPRAICFYENRLCLAGTAYQPNYLWTSQSGDFENMLAGSLDSDAILYEVGSASQNPILWMKDKRGIIAGTTGSIITISSTGEKYSFTPSTIHSERSCETGSCNIQPALTVNSLIYVDRNRRKVRSLRYDLQTDNLISPDLTIFSQDITDPNIRDMAWQKRPDDVGWFVKNDGNMVTLTYNELQGVDAWTQMVTDGNFVSVCCIPGEDEDEIWAAVERTIDSNDVVYIECFGPQKWTEETWFVDCGLEYSGTATSTLTGADHLEGETVQVYTDANGYIGDFTVSGGQIDLGSYSVTQAIAGLGYTARLKTFPFEVQGAGGYSVGLRKNLRQITLCLYQSEGGRYGYQTMYDIKYPAYTTDFFTGLAKLDLMSGYQDEVYLIIDQNEPLPLGLTGIVLNKFEVSSDN